MVTQLAKSGPRPNKCVLFLQVIKYCKSTGQNVVMLCWLLSYHQTHFFTMVIQVKIFAEIGSFNHNIKLQLRLVYVCVCEFIFLFIYLTFNYKQNCKHYCFYLLHCWPRFLYSWSLMSENHMFPNLRTDINYEAKWRGYSQMD